MTKLPKIGSILNNNLINFMQKCEFFVILGMFALNQSQTIYIYDICISKIEFEDMISNRTSEIVQHYLTLKGCKGEIN